MKKLLFIFGIILLCVVSNAQTIEQAFNKKSSWTEVRTNMFDDSIFEITTYKIDGDTSIGDKNYSRIFINNDYFSALRETDDKKIYVYFSDDFLYPARELLIYDFDWYPGKTLYCQAEYEDSIVQAVLGNSIDSIQLLDEKYYKCVKDDFGETRLIRGIGNTQGFFSWTFGAPTDGSQFALLCFYIDDTLVYSNPGFNYCNVNSIKIVTDNDPKIKLYPNPSNSNVIVEFLENLSVDTFKIFDVKGTLIKECEVGNKGSIEIQNLAKGVYIYSVILKNNQKLSGKIIIQ